MAATVNLYEGHGTVPSGNLTDTAGSIAFSSVDIASVTAADYPIEIPDDGSINHSYEMWLRFRCTVAPVTQVENFKFWTDGTNPATGLTVSGVAGGDIAVNGSGYAPVSTGSTIAIHNISGYVAGDELSVSGTLTTDVVEDCSDWLVLQLNVTSGAATAAMAQQTYFYSYDES